MDPERLDEVSEEIAHLSDQHTDVPLDAADLDADPFVQFAAWLEEALRSQPRSPISMTLATADASGRPSARTVLLKGLDPRGFTFFTNYESRKGRDLSENPFAALVFYWPQLERQVCVRGRVERLSRSESEEYFVTRPHRSRLSAWASWQSSPLEDRAALSARMAELEERFGDRVPLPDHWGGFLLVPEAFEFWKSRKDRLHDRFAYEPGDGGWRITRLHP